MKCCGTCKWWNRDMTFPLYSDQYAACLYDIDAICALLPSSVRPETEACGSREGEDCPCYAAVASNVAIAG